MSTRKKHYVSHGPRAPYSALGRKKNVQRDAEVVELFNQGKTYLRIAGELGLTLGTVAGIVYRSGYGRKLPQVGTKSKDYINVSAKVVVINAGEKIGKYKKNRVSISTLAPTPVREPTSKPKVQASKPLCPPRRNFQKPGLLGAHKVFETPSKPGAYTLLDLPPNGCKYVTGHLAGEPRLTYRMCGCDKGSHRAYCPTHAKATTDYRLR